MGSAFLYCLAADICGICVLSAILQIYLRFWSFICVLSDLSSVLKRYLRSPHPRLYSTPYMPAFRKQKAKVLLYLQQMRFTCGKLQFTCRKRYLLAESLPLLAEFHTLLAINPNRPSTPRFYSHKTKKSRSQVSCGTLIRNSYTYNTNRAS